MDTMKKYICLLMLVGTFQISGMKPITSGLKPSQSTQNQVAQIDYDKQLQDVIVAGITPSNVGLALSALENGAKPNVMVSKGFGIATTLLADIVANFYEPHLKPLFDALIKAKVDVNLPDSGVPPLAVALTSMAYNRGSETSVDEEQTYYYYIEALLKAGARTTDQMSPTQEKILYKTVGYPTRGFDRVLKMMIDAGAPIHLCDDRYGTPLQWAVYSGSENAVKILLAAGASVLGQDKNNKNVIDYAKKPIPGAAARDRQNSIVVLLQRTMPGHPIAELLQRTVVGRKAKRAALIAILQGNGKVEQTAPICALPEPLMCLIVEYFVPTI